MAIERAIYGSLSCGIEEVGSGYQYFTYTANYKELIKGSSIQGKLEAAYVAPQTFVTYNALMEKPDDARDINAFADEIMKEHPQRFAYWADEIGGEKKACFSYGKNLGMDWTGTRPNPVYTSVTIADFMDIKKYPISYSSSPSVACDVRRCEFYPDNGILPKPKMLVNLTSLEADDANIGVKHTNGYPDVSITDIQRFLAQDNRIEYLKSMITALMKYKDGNLQCRILVADKKENMIYWITSISYVFPLVNTLGFSFSTYESSDFSFDFNGVFRCKINNIADDGYEPTSYDFNRCINTHAVYDFQEGYSSEMVTVEDSPFFIMLERAFSANLSRLDEYKNFIQQYTGYDKLDSRYVDGYNLFALCSKKAITLEFDELVKAYSFAREYCSKALCKTALDVLYEIYPKYLDNEGIADLLKDFIAFAVEQKLQDENAVNDRFLNELLINFGKCSSMEEFYRQGEFVEKICSLKNGMLEAGFIKCWGVPQIVQQLPQIGEKWKWAFIQNAMCHYVAKGYGRLDNKSESDLTGVFYALAYYVAEYNENYIRKTVEHANKVFNDPKMTFTFAHITNEVFIKKVQNPTLMEQYISDWYCNSDIGAKTKLLQSIQHNNAVSRYVPYILSQINRDMDFKRVIDETRILVDSNVVNLGEFAARIRTILMDIIAVESKECTKPYLIYDAYVVLLQNEEKYRVNVVQSDIEIILQGYLSALNNKYMDMNINKEDMEQLRAICGNIQNSFLDGKMKELVMICVSYGYIGTLNKDIARKPRESVFYKVSPESLPKICYLPSEVAGKFLKSAIEAAGKHWMVTDHFPEIEYICHISDKSQIYSITIDYYMGLLSYILENEKSKEKIEKASVLIKRAYLSDTEENGSISNVRKKGKLPSVTKMAETIAAENKLKAVIRKITKDYEKLHKHGGYFDGMDKVGMKNTIDILEEVYDYSQKGIIDTISDIAFNVLERFKKE